MIIIFLQIEVARLETLDFVTNELRLRTLLWENATSWAKAIDEWQNADFEILDIDVITSFTMRILKTVNLLEKGLPTNQVLLLLKEDTELMKNKLPVISCLKNPNLKQRHWLKIESLLDYRFRPEEMITLNIFENLGVFLYPDELMEISITANSEASLESMLNKVKV